MEFKLSQLYVPRTLIYSLYNPISNHKQQLHLHGQILCRCQIQGMSSKTQEPTKKFLIHVVKLGETLNSISKLYGVPICDIAAVNEDVADVDLVFEGQELNIPSPGTTQVQQDKSETAHSAKSSPERALHVGLYRKFLNMKNSTATSCHHLSYAKTTGYFLVMVPLVAFCIRCIMDAFNNRHAKDLDHNSASESERHHHRSRKMRWRTALLDLRDPDELDTNPRPDIDHFIEDEDQMDSNDLSRTYTKLEEDYQKFLSECGMSNWGYLRQGEDSSK